MLKRIAALISITALLLTCTGCAVLSTWFGTSSSAVSAVEETYLQELQSAPCYQQLEPLLQDGYARVYAAVRKHETDDNGVEVVTLDGQRRWALSVELARPVSSQQDIARLFLALTTDHPQFFFLDYQYRIRSYRVGDKEQYTGLTVYFLYDADGRQQAASRLETAVTALLQPMKEGLSEFERELWVHDRLAAVCTYEAAAAAEPSATYPQAFTVYGALVDGRAVCEGYARAFQLLLRRVGLACTLVSGTDRDGVAHMWNVVTVDGQGYHVDVTWNDTEDRGLHTYFNLTTEEIARTHTLDSDNIAVPVCTATEANYYRQQGLWLDTLQRDEIARVIAQEVRRGRTVIELRFAPSAFVNARLFINNGALVVSKVNEQLAQDGQPVWDYATYTVDEHYHIVALFPPRG